MQLQSRVQRAKSETKEVHTPPSLPMQRRFGLTTYMEYEVQRSVKILHMATQKSTSNVSYSRCETSCSCRYISSSCSWWILRQESWGVNLYVPRYCDLCFGEISFRQCCISFQQRSLKPTQTWDPPKISTTRSGNPASFDGFSWGWSVKRVGVLDSAVDCWPNRFPKWGVPTWGFKVYRFRPSPLGWWDLVDFWWRCFFKGIQMAVSFADWTMTWRWSMTSLIKLMRELLVSR